MPYVSLNEVIGNPVSTVLADDIMGTTLAMQHFFELGHRKIAYANAHKAAFSHYSVNERHDTVMRYSGQHGMQVAEGHDVRFESADNFLANAIMTQRATAVLATIIRSAFSCSVPPRAWACASR